MLPYLAPLLAQEVGASLADAQHLRLLLRCAAQVCAMPPCCVAPEPRAAVSLRERYTKLHGT